MNQSLPTLETHQAWRIGWKACSSDDERYASVECHGAITAALADGDSERGKRHMAGHVDGAVAILPATGIN